MSRMISKQPPKRIKPLSESHTLPRLQKIITVTKLDPDPSTTECLFKGIYVNEAQEQLIIAKGKYIMKLSLRTLKLIYCSKIHEQPIYKLIHIPTQNLFATASWDHSVKIFCFKQSYREKRCLKFTDQVFSIDYCPKNNLIAVCGRFPNIFVQNFDTGKSSSIAQGKTDIFLSVKFISDKNLLAATTYHQAKLIRAIIIDVKTMDVLYKIQDPSGYTKASFCLQYDKVEETLLIGNQFSEIEGWKYQQKKGERRFLKAFYHKEPVENNNKAFYDDILANWRNFKLVAVDSNYVDGAQGKKPALQFFTQYKQGKVLRKELPYKGFVTVLTTWKKSLLLGSGSGERFFLFG